MKVDRKLLGVLIVVSILLGVVAVSQFRLRSMQNLALSQTCNPEQARLGQVVNVAIIVQNNDEKDVTISRMLLKLPPHFDVLNINVVYPNGTKASGLSIGESGELKQKRALLKTKQKLDVSVSLNTTLESRTGNFTTIVYATYQSGGIFGIGTEDVTIMKTAQTTIRVPFEAWYQLLKDIHDSRWLRYVVGNSLCIEDGKLTDLEKNYLLSPTPENAQKLVESYLLDLKGVPDIGPELAAEIPRIPDFRYDNKTVEALEDILQLAMKPGHKQGFIDILNEGIKEKRKYCTPLQALLWYAYDFEFTREHESLVDEPFKLVERSWVDSSTSRNYTSNKWQNLDEVIDRLSSPSLLAIYMWNTIGYAWAIPRVLPEYRGIWQSPQETFNRRLGNCGDQGMFAAYCLSRNGYDAYALSVFWFDKIQSKEREHVVCTYAEKSGSHYFLDNTFTIGGERSRYKVIQGPFRTIREMCERYPVLYSQGEGVWRRCYLIPPMASRFNEMFLDRYLHATNP